jgi:hypothetical protein
MTEESLSRLATTHFRTSEKFLSLRCLMRSFTATSEKDARIPLSISPPTEYLWHSLRTLRQSGKCLLTNSTITLSSYLMFSLTRISHTRLKNRDAIFGRSLFVIENSTTEQREWRGSMILFL